MKVLLVKMSSLGDVVHTLPAVTDLSRARPEVALDWVVEEGFEAIPRMHPFVNTVIPIGLRRWRSRGGVVNELPAFARHLRRQHYDRVIDAQGLFKSAMVVALSRGPAAGFSWRSAREPLASVFYRQRIRVPRDRHAITRVRALFAASFGYRLPDSHIDYGLRPPSPETRSRVLFLHGTTWPSKHWPEHYWCELARRVSAEGYEVWVPHGNDEELRRAKAIAEPVRGQVLARSGIGDLFSVMAEVSGIVSVDTGLGHLAAAVGVPLVGLYGATDPRLTGPAGQGQQVLASDHLPCIPCLARECRQPPADAYPPCFEPLTPERVWRTLQAEIRAGTE